jgi:hypothetical protein
LLVEAAHHYRRRPRIGEKLAARHTGRDPRVVEVAWRAQRPLCQRWQRWQHLVGERRMHTGTVAVAVARELAAFLWVGRDPELIGTDIPALRMAAGARTSSHEGRHVATQRPRAQGLWATRRGLGGCPFLECEPGDGHRS